MGMKFYDEKVIGHVHTTHQAWIGFAPTKGLLTLKSIPIQLPLMLVFRMFNVH